MKRTITLLTAVLLVLTGCRDDVAGDCPDPEHPAPFTFELHDHLTPAELDMWTAADVDGDGMICLTPAEYPIATGTEWKPPVPPAPAYPAL